MCMGVIIRREGQRDIHCGSVRELARWFTAILPSNDDLQSGELPTPRIDSMAEDCLCPVDIPASAKTSGYACDVNESYLDYICSKESRRDA